MADKKQKVHNSLRIGPRELDALVDRIESGSTANSNKDREFVRWEFRNVTVVLTIENAGGSTVSIPVVAKDISRGGISLLHSAYVYPDSKCTVSFKVPDGRTFHVKGRIARCMHIGGKVHEVGIAFDEQVSTRDLLGLDPMEEAYSLERVTPEQLMGTVLIVTKSEMDRELLLRYLQDTQLTIRVAENVEEAMERAQKGCDLIFSDLHLGEESGLDLVTQCRAEGIDVPFMIMTSDDSDETRDDLRMSGVNGYFSKPIEQQRFYQAMAEFMLADGDGGPVYTTLSESNPAFEFLANFYTSVPQMVVGLEKALQESNLESCRELCRTLAGTAAPLGFQGVGEQAIKADRALTKGSAVRDAASEVRALIIACRRIRVKPAA
ncbi:MAG: response regulator [Phycisphaerales bacterium]|nr:response regulator [Phycisphaerales bacterium]